MLLSAPRAGPFLQQAERLGVEVHVVDTSRSFNLGSVRKLRGLVRGRGVDLIHAHTPLPGSLLARYTGMLTGVPVITHAHVRDSLNRHALIRGYQRALNRITSRSRRSRVIAVAEAVADAVVRQGVDRRRLRVVYNGVRAPESRRPRAAVRAELGISATAPVALHIGRLCESKGQARLLEAAARVLRTIPECRVLLVGEDLAAGGAYERELKARADQLGLGDVARFLGRRADVPDLLAAADVLALPSTTEGLPLVLLESMAAGCPVVASRVDGNPELVEDGESGTLVSPGDPDALAAAILWHLQNPEASRDIGRRGAERVRRHFTIEAMLAGTFAVYDELLHPDGHREPDAALQVGPHAA